MSDDSKALELLRRLVSNALEKINVKSSAVQGQKELADIISGLDAGTLPVFLVGKYMFTLFGILLNRICFVLQMIHSHFAAGKSRFVLFVRSQRHTNPRAPPRLCA